MEKFKPLLKPSEGAPNPAALAVQSFGMLFRDEQAFNHFFSQIKNILVKGLQRNGATTYQEIYSHDDLGIIGTMSQGNILSGTRLGTIDDVKRLLEYVGNHDPEVRVRFEPADQGTRVIYELQIANPSEN